MSVDIPLHEKISALVLPRDNNGEPLTPIDALQRADLGDPPSELSATKPTVGGQTMDAERFGEPL